ncbi:MAG: hypothetical protein ACI35J_13740 [Peribacillus sp.]
MRDEMIYAEIESMNEGKATASFVKVSEDWEGCRGQWHVGKESTAWKFSNHDSNLVESEVQ